MEILQNKIDTDELSTVMKMTVGAILGALVLSFSTHHVLTPELPKDKVSNLELAHHFEREREVLHGHSALARTRTPSVAGGSE